MMKDHLEHVLSKIAEENLTRDPTGFHKERPFDSIQIFKYPDAFGENDGWFRAYSIGRVLEIVQSDCVFVETEKDSGCLNICQINSEEEKEEYINLFSYKFLDVIDYMDNLIYIDKSGISNINILDYLYLSDYAHILNKLDNITNLNSYWCEKFRSIISNDFQKLFGDYNQSG